MERRFFGYWVYETECHRLRRRWQWLAMEFRPWLNAGMVSIAPSSDARQLTVNALRPCREGRGHLDVTLIGMPLIHARGRVS